MAMQLRKECIGALFLIEPQYFIRTVEIATNYTKKCK